MYFLSPPSTDINQSGEIDVKDFEQAIEVRRRSEEEVEVEVAVQLVLQGNPVANCDVAINNLFQLEFTENLQVARMGSGLGEEQGDPRDDDVHLGGHPSHRRQRQ